MTEPRFAFVPVMDHEIHVTEWGTPGAPAVLMMHGLARTGRDFDEIAAGLSDTYHVLCPDMIGRGLSSWSVNPDAEYSVEYYAGIASDLMDHYRLDRAAWFGTSLGGQIGMRMASGAHADRLTCLLINDIGPEVPEAAIERIQSYVGNPPHFDSFTKAEIWLRNAYAPFGPASDAFWHRLARCSLRRRSDGRLTLHYDPAIIRHLAGGAATGMSWDRWARITTPCHLFHGAKSDLVTEEIFDKMKQSGPKPDSTVIDDCGHAPTLSRAQDVLRVRQVLNQLG
ncbi:alpha/beta hydrolase [Pseudooceanicola sp.]|uniref:alpha/beta fold hydrolase n=1 Tax=Pseudooceanicola sp. TaxID=1914328 RepID=UPI0026135588|nr:alpha/beta hydrolase [Pseudooceanicola sp.]MDF1855856.1 alpha/beta hydrolase [Pseudooceanicola sp.]